MTKIGSLLVLLCVIITGPVQAQLGLSSGKIPSPSYDQPRLHQQALDTKDQRSLYSLLAPDSAQSSEPTYPDPNQVLYKSLMIPGWGQVINKQIWKVPIIYALLGGLTYYSIHLTKQYHDYRAAYYNITHQDGDRPYGPTPDYLQSVTSDQSLKTSRNFYRNRRDFIYITIGLAYGLNAVDAYVFAHMRSFDVSDDLTIRSRLKPEMKHWSPMLTLHFQLVKK